MRDSIRQQRHQPDERLAMNISTEYGPGMTDGMAGRSYPRSSSYYGRYYAAGAGGSHVSSFGMSSKLEDDGLLDPGPLARRFHDRPAALGGFSGNPSEAFASDKSFYSAPGPSYMATLGEGQSGAFQGDCYGGPNYSHQGALRMPQELGMYGGGFGPAGPWYHQQHPSYHHGHHHAHSHHHHHNHLQQQQQQHHHQSAAPRCYPMPPEHMYNMFNFNRNGREARNRAEKNRRDKLNGSIQELSAMVPHVAESPRRVDKTAVLRFSAHGLRVDYVFGKSKPEETVKPEAQDSLFRMLNGFLLTVTCRGQIVLVSPSVEHFLGHCQTDLYGQNLFNLTHPDDHAMLKQQLIPSNLGNVFDAGTAALLSPSEGASSNDADTEYQRSHDEEEEIDRKLRQDHRRFTIRMARAGPRSETTAYELVTIDGCFRRADCAPRGSPKAGSSSGMQMVRRARGRDDAIPLHSINGNDIVLISLARVMKVPSICDRLIEACKYEYKTRHLIDGRIVQCDQRISIVAGYLTDEVSGLSPFTFMHRDDVRWVIVALRQMYDYNQNGESCYRLMSRTGDFIYLKTRGYLEVDSDTKVVQSFVCINTLVSEEEGQRLVREMKRKFSVIVDKVELPDESGEPVVENPKQIEEAVMNLITNLQPDSEDKLLMAMPGSPASSVKSGYGEGAPLAIVAPEKNSIKSAIVKSINVVSIASKTMRENRCSSVAGEWSPLSEDQQSSNGSSGTSTTGMASPNGLASSGDPVSPSQAPSRSPTGVVSPAPPQRPTVLHKTDPVGQLPTHEGRGERAGVEQRVPPLPNSEHYFTQPFSPSNGTGSVPVSVLSPASTHYGQRNVRSPFGGGSVSSPPAAVYTRAGGCEGPAGGGGSFSRTTTVLKRTYSNSSISSVNSVENSDNDTLVGGAVENKRTRMNLGTPDLTTCFNDLINPGTDLTSFLPSSFDALDQSLLTMETTTTIIRDRVSGYSNLHDSQDRLERIVEEHQEQREMLQSIQEEYQMQLQSNGGTRAMADPDASGELVATTTTADVVFCNSLSAGPTTRRCTNTTTAASMVPSVITSNVVQRPAPNASTGSELDPGS